ncbi:MAG: PQQ-binding-like beta-propeller repeat protein [Pseudomonadales bacterium]|nr:PQQ-binding-like beta-propeller repeat protein [Pseudomonadales bacterium]
MSGNSAAGFVRLGRTAGQLLCRLGLIAAAACALAAPPDTALHEAGAAVYRQQCATCHDRTDLERPGPTLATMLRMHPAQLEFALTRGKMQEQARGLSREQRFALMQYLGAAAAGAGDAGSALRCAPERMAIDLVEVGVAGWGVDAASTRHQPASRTRIDAGNVVGLELAWAFGLPGVTEARSQPVITVDTLFVLTVPGNVFALDRDTGCIKWQYRAPVPLRTALSLGVVGDRSVLFFGDLRAHVTALDAATGEQVWRQSVGLFETSALTGAVVPHGDTLFVPLSSMEVGAAANPEYPCCRSHGALLALDASTGAVRWTSPMTPPAQPTGRNAVGVEQWGPSGATVWSTPTVDAVRGLVYVGTGQNLSAPATGTSDAIVAVDMQTGAHRWVFQGTPGDVWNMACGRNSGPNCPAEPGPDFDFGASPILVSTSAGRPLLLAGQKSGTVHALDPDTGAPVWQTRLGEGSALGGIHWGMAVAGQRLLVPVADPERPGRRARPGLHALDVASGAVLWSHGAERGCEFRWQAALDAANPWPDCPFAYGYSAAPMSANDLVFVGSLDGYLRAFAVADGRLLWEYATARPFEAVNGVSTHGGAIDSAGPQVAGDMVFVQSGYGSFGQMPGNALLAFRLASQPGR